MKICNIHYSVILGIGALFSLPGCLGQGNNPDDLFFQNKKKMLTARWNSPFSQAERASKHAPKGPTWETEMWDWSVILQKTDRPCNCQK